MLLTGPCSDWTGSRRGPGYGWDSEANDYAHRAAYREAHGEIPDGLVIDHLCGNKMCVNPAHLEVVTIGENVRRHFRKADACKNGHPWTPENTYWRKEGRRVCKACRRERMATRNVVDATPVLRGNRANWVPF